jgi:hypothetical protein
MKAARKDPMPPALKALRRAAKRALELARLTGTPCYVLRGGQIVDIAKSTRKIRKKAQP